MANAHQITFSAAAVLLIKGSGGVCRCESLHTPTQLLLEGLLGQCEVCQLLLHIGGEELVSRGEIKPKD